MSFSGSPSTSGWRAQRVARRVVAGGGAARHLVQSLQRGEQRRLVRLLHNLDQPSMPCASSIAAARPPA